MSYMLTKRLNWTSIQNPERNDEGRNGPMVYPMYTLNYDKPYSIIAFDLTYYYYRPEKPVTYNYVPGVGF